MSHRDYGIGEGIGGLAALMITLSLVTLYIVVRVSVFIIHTFVKYPRQRLLWVFLAVFVLSVSVGGLLAYTSHNASWSVLGVIGFLALTLVAYITELRKSQTLLKQPDNIVHAVLHTKWFGEADNENAA